MLERWSNEQAQTPGWVQKPLACDFIAYLRSRGITMDPPHTLRFARLRYPQEDGKRPALATGAFALATLLPAQDFLSWGWRVPFLLSLAMAAVGLFIRLNIEETPDFERARRDPNERLPLVIVMFSGAWPHDRG